MITVVIKVAHSYFSMQPPELPKFNLQYLVM
ncbi:hypothetical protein SPHINGO8AM_110037 [Sphingomonas sp. 8AM]|nr:hypothetical protein SPHINGO8AM_110037 [Sphingomonas sp. 8AM]